MSSIIVGHFAQAEQLEQARAAIAARDFAADEYSSYYLNPPGQHGLLRFGGDSASDEGASEAGKGAATAALIGGAAGLAIGSVGGPIGALAGAGVGAYVGSLAGALGRTHSAHPEQASVEHPAEPPAGPVLCVRVDRPGSEAVAVSVLTDCGARQIERASGTWAEGDWQDYDPRRPVEILYRATQPGPATGT
ncbi:hypothetical protein [Aromatoleum anaerobium]|uniref:Glycine zipper domain-containing protein n=1 Tax=Aromatoleum anaerobium TaxID=182180 RepID=A0ABX1PIF4_9RHOO|nr:hypothetical protein [Aromatoleum anaerobium]MCK0508354.1 hypothetical protein [Aromatoleum anaerobium]